jgi:hypothetical protein
MTSENHIARAIRELELRRGSEPTPASADAPWKNEIADAVIDGKPEYVILEAYRTISAQLSAMQAERDRMKEALEEIGSMGYAGAPDIQMRKIARAAIPIHPEGEKP